MSVKLATLRTKTLTGDTPDGLDGNVRTFVQGLGEERLLDLTFVVAPNGQYVAFIAYTT